MVSEEEVEGIAKLADISIDKDELAGFTSQFNNILGYFDILDTVEYEETKDDEILNILREDEVMPSLSQADALSNADETEDGYIKSPKVM
ncbi:Asp-tRNA(Asn)/Glu-tRNA(Gln) amidotransferase subunit GatC [Methanomicrobium antiquum]|jgi:aspartyl-tRNA(Asn)/glutamyl-tRNA(Gln) amidotransferase subunit C|uniref:Aspartyl/glutamyl-tRNA(Asn/Gln) amidotransferase subunit C n=1 Tax=Methanomicrobium antiquum TaxID=487686 RepID=A0AAF0FTW9_9EURY|nr:Asp-tRNA(Asn)/Glu-tRNA(Gln) amidotransferase subunit GatC [Methanomicrobium antiquum]MDD3977043.1 Asp-tRNA(Asn)/Glu-tRNA(Gln) amidotransferase subunit GatC [Methanomicrobium sp.]WFN35840.1 Asp-tRNA(Asn)/Glu-tRNA(Gln) amidotransferase subunit GatC [Methanomicrobium antiquum]